MNQQELVMEAPIKPVGEVIQDPEPDQSWMDTPIPKVKFYEWGQETTGMKTLVKIYLQLSGCS